LAGDVLLAAGAGVGTGGFAVLDAAPGFGGGSTSGPFWPQPASKATTRQNGSKSDRCMARFPVDGRSIARRAEPAAVRVIAVMMHV
jgi:hypothetical protein